MVAVYLDTNESVLLKSNDRTFHVLFYILRQLDFERNLWYADKQNKITIMHKLGISPPTLDKHIASLKERGLYKKEYIDRIEYETKAIKKMVLRFTVQT